MAPKVLGITAHFRRQDGKPPLIPEVKSGWSRYYYNSNYPPSSRRRAARLDLLGDDYCPNSVSSAMTWSDTPQGGPYWCARSDGVADLNDDDRDYIRYLITEHS